MGCRQGQVWGKESDGDTGGCKGPDVQDLGSPSLGRCTCIEMAIVWVPRWVVGGVKGRNVGGKRLVMILAAEGY